MRSIFVLFIDYLQLNLQKDFVWSAAFSPKESQPPRASCGHEARRGVAQAELSGRGRHPVDVHPAAREEAQAGLPELAVGEICITWIGHASFLIQTPEHGVASVDPNWAKWLKVIKRIRQPGMEIHDLPAIDLVLVTHAHFDHLDRKTLRAVASDQPVVVPEHVGGLVHGLGFRHVQELRCWEAFELGSLKITLTPARHWGARIIHDNHRGFGGFHVEYAGRSVFHCGDSAYFDGFKEIGERLPVEIALLPIGAYDAPTKRDVHMNPEQALRAFVELNARTMIHAFWNLPFELRTASRTSPAAHGARGGASSLRPHLLPQRGRAEGFLNRFLSRAAEPAERKTVMESSRPALWVAHFLFSGDL